MQILFLTSTGQLGGAERSLLDLLASVRQAQPDSQLTVVTGESGPLSEACQKIGVAVRVVSLPRNLARLGDAGAGGPAGSELSRTLLVCRLAIGVFAAFRYARSLRNLFTELKPDIVHTNGLKMHILAAWAKPSNVPLVWHVHDYVSSRPIMVRLLRVFVGRCNAAVVNSTSVAEDFKSALKPRIAVHTIWNAVNLQEFSPDGPMLDLDAASNLPPAPNGVVRIGLVATFGKQKGHPIFLKALAKLPANLPIRAYVIGGPLYRTDASQWCLDDLRRQAAELGLAGRVGFTGFVDTCAQAMRSLDIVIHASTKPEPFGLVIVEAMACRRALIASRAGGASEIFSDGVNALGHIPGDAEDLAALIIKLTTSPELREQLGRAGRQTAERHFDRARLGTQLTPIYRSLAPLRHAWSA